MYEYKYIFYLGVLNIRSKFICIELSNVIVGNLWLVFFKFFCRVLRNM